MCLDGSDRDASNTCAVPALIEGRVLDAVSGQQIEGAKVDVWPVECAPRPVCPLTFAHKHAEPAPHDHASPCASITPTACYRHTSDFRLTATNGQYAVQDASADPRNLCGYMHTDAAGSFSFKAIKPTPYKVPEDGPGGQLMSFMGRHPWRPAHLHFIISAPGYQKVTTHLFCRDDPYLHEDAVFAVLDSLVLDWPELHDEDEAAALGFAKVPFTKIAHDFWLAPQP